MNGFSDEIPLMINRACRIQGISQKELAKLIGYSEASFSRIAKGHDVESMPIRKLMVLMELSKCSYEWKRGEIYEELQN